MNLYKGIQYTCLDLLLLCSLSLHKWLREYLLRINKLIPALLFADIFLVNPNKANTKVVLVSCFIS